MSKPLAIDLFCGLGGWTEGLLAEGYSVIGFDTERHAYGDDFYPGQLVIQDVLTIRGSQFKNVDLIVASPPCQEFSYMAMPWSLAKEKQRKIEACPKEQKRLTALFDACFRIQLEACEAAGRHIPMVVENVRGAQKWVGRANWNFGSFYLWGDVPALMPITPKKGVMKAGITHRSDGSTSFHGTKVPGMNWSNHGKPGYKSLAFNGQADKRLRNEGQKVPGFRFDGSGGSFQTASVEGVKQGGDWFNETGPGQLRSFGPKSTARKRASAMIAKIPLVLSRHIASVYK